MQSPIFSNQKAFKTRAWKEKIIANVMRAVFELCSMAEKMCKNSFASNQKHARWSHSLINFIQIPFEMSLLLIFCSFYLTPFDVGTYLRITIRHFFSARATLLRALGSSSQRHHSLLPLLSSYFYDWNLCVDVRFILSFVNCAPVSIVLDCIVWPGE